MNIRIALHTDWVFLVEPTNPGVYAVRDPRQGFARHDGKVWYGTENTVEAAAANNHISDVQSREWCGLTQEAYEMMKGMGTFPPHPTEMEKLVLAGRANMRGVGPDRVALFDGNGMPRVVFGVLG